jgi:type II secretion system protein D
MEIIQQIEDLSVETEPAVELRQLHHVEGQALAAMIQELYAQVFAPRQGSVSITPLVKPNALLLVGRRENVDTVLELIGRLDRPVAPATQFRVFQLEHASAESARVMVEEFYAERGGLGTQVRVTADYRTNALVVQAGPRDLEEVAEMIARLDVPTSQAVNEIRLFKLENSLAEEVAPILQEAINPDAEGRRAVQPGAAQPAADGQAAARARTGSEQRALMLKLITVDAAGQRLLSSGVLTDVRITADPRANALVVSAPSASMPLVAALIRELDQLPAAEAQIKVFTIVNGDAVNLVEMLETLFAQPAGADQPAVQTAAVEGESSLVPLRFAVDARTNSIIASGSVGDLTVVEAILLRLDESDVRNRKSTVVRLKNAPAEAVADAVNEFLTSQRQVEQIQPELFSPFEQMEREVIVVPEPVSNSLILSATPRFFEEIMELVERLDERPPMVLIQVVIAEVALNDTDEFGVEVGLQDSILFDRSILGDIVTTTETIFDEFGNPTTTNETITAATNTPGFNFNNQPLGNSGGQDVLDNAHLTGTQGLAHFAVGRLNNELGFGGLVLSASSESVSVLVRALKECRRLDVLSRPQIMTLDNQPAFIQVGQRVPRITGTQINETGQVNQVTLENVGLILGVTPRISPDGLVVMEIDAEKSELGPEAEGIPISISATGEVIRSPRINTTTAQTTVAAVSGQTIILGGLITKFDSQVNRKVPLLGDVPVLGNLFRYDLDVERRTELLIIMTPHIVQNEDDAELLEQVEAARMHWCLSDVLEIHGDIGVRARSDEWSDAETTVIFPDGLEDAGGQVPQLVPGEPARVRQIAPEDEGSPFIDEPLPTEDGAAGTPQSGGVTPMVYYDAPPRSGAERTVRR